MRLDSLLQFGEALDWETLLVRQLWQVSLLVGVVFILAKYVARHRPHIAYLLWAFVLIKAVTPPDIATPISPWNWLPREDAYETTVVNQTQFGEAVEPTTQTVTSFEQSQFPAKTPATSSLAGSGEVSQQSRAGEWLIGVWLFGIAACSILFFTKWLRLRAQITSESEPANARLILLVNQQADALHVRRKFRVRITSSLGPGVFGVITPQLLLPKHLVADTDSAILNPIIAHELIHVRRGDTIAGLFQAVVQTFWWFHPLVWLANREARLERERCCDCEVVARTSHRPIDYARSLVSAIESYNDSQTRTIPSLVGITNGETTARRLTEIVRRGDNVPLPRPITYRSLVAICILLVLPGAPTHNTLQADDVAELSTTFAANNESAIDESEGTGPAQFGVRNAPPVVIQTIPPAGSSDVDPATTQIQVTFSKPMHDRSWSWVQIDKDSFPKIVGEPHYSDDRQTCIVDVKLEPNKTYAIWLNHDQYGNFRDAAGQSAIPYLLAFKTRSN